MLSWMLPRLLLPLQHQRGMRLCYLGMDDLDLRSLSTFVEVARRRSFTAAATELHLAQSAVSRTVRDLERKVGAALLLRTTRSVELTPVGRELLRLAERVLECHGQAKRDLQRFLSGDGGGLDLAALPSVSAVLLPAVVASFVQTRPGARIVIRDGLHEQVLQDVASGRADLGITLAHDLPNAVTADILLTDSMAAVLPIRHHLADFDNVSWAQLGAGPFIALSTASSVRSLTDAAFHAAGVTVDNFVEAANTATVGGLVAAGLGVSALPALVHALVKFADLASRPLIDPQVARQIGVITRREAVLSPQAQRFIIHLHTHVAQLSGPLRTFGDAAVVPAG